MQSKWKITLLCAALTVLFVGAGCGNNRESEGAANAPGASASPPAEATGAVQQSQQAEQADAARRGAAAPKQP